jgi:hypothetical protein
MPVLGKLYCAAKPSADMVGKMLSLAQITLQYLRTWRVSVGRR